mmetsp:Transcript_25353/g.29214  ORF Transcript_25353/g.29214 Transcript_25353/m.29214 type:complete len:115 (+) Transcript_25353:63-407(+)
MRVQEQESVPSSTAQFEDKAYKEWSSKVLSDHAKTTVDLNTAIRTVKDLKNTVRKSIRETRQVINVWNNYNNEYGKACKRLARRLSECKQREELVKLIHDNKDRIVKNHMHPTK